MAFKAYKKIMKENIRFKELEDKLGETSSYEEAVLIAKNFLQRTIDSVYACNTYEESEEDINKIDFIQTYLATLLYKYDVHLDSELKFLVEEYDRLDDIETRHKLYERIKCKGTY